MTEANPKFCLAGDTAVSVEMQQDQWEKFSQERRQAKENNHSRCRNTSHVRGEPSLTCLRVRLGWVFERAQQEGVHPKALLLRER